MGFEHSPITSTQAMSQDIEDNRTHTTECSGAPVERLVIPPWVEGEVPKEFSGLAHDPHVEVADQDFHAPQRCCSAPPRVRIG